MDVLLFLMEKKFKDFGKMISVLLNSRKLMEKRMLTLDVLKMGLTRLN